MSAEPTFLYVDDNDQSREIMEILLTYVLGYSQVYLFEDTADFMSRFEALPHRPTIIFLDIHMTPTNGFDVLRQLRDHHDYKDTTVIAVTASVMNEEVQMLKDAGFNGAIAKPLKQEAFPAILTRILNKEAVWRIVE